MWGLIGFERPAERAALLLALLETLSDINAGKLRHIRGTYRIPYGIRDKPSWFHSEFLELARGLLGRKLEFTQDQIMRLVQLAGLNNRGNHLFPVLLALFGGGRSGQITPSISVRCELGIGFGQRLDHRLALGQDR